MSVLPTDESGGTEEFDVEVLEISQNGARVCTYDLDREYLHKIRKSLRGTCLYFSKGHQRGRLFGRMVWICEHRRHVTQMGVAFIETKITGETESWELLKQLANDHTASLDETNITKRLSEEEARTRGAASFRPMASPNRPQTPPPTINGEPVRQPPSFKLATPNIAMPLHQPKPPNPPERPPLPKPVDLPKGPGEKRSAQRFPCEFDAQFQFQSDSSKMDERIFKVKVNDASWRGVNIQCPPDVSAEIQTILTENKVKEKKFFQNCEGWLMIEFAHQRFSVFGKIVRQRTISNDDDKSGIQEFGLALQGDENETKFARMALLDMAHANPLNGKS